MIYIIRKRQIVFTIIILVCIGIIFSLTQYVPTIATPVTNRTVIIDAGHGGGDPGAIGISGTLEKDINLQIALKVKKYLESNDVKVVMTRENTEGFITGRSRSDLTTKISFNQFFYGLSGPVSTTHPYILLYT